VKESIPFVAAVLALVLVLIFFPDLVLFIPRALF
jgi:TRAP-type C4-dicarboxylate transport system permease large subunit